MATLGLRQSLYVWCERSIRPFSLVVNLSLNCASPIGSSNMKSRDWAPSVFATLENPNQLPSVESSRCDLVNSLNEVNTMCEQLQ